MSYHVALMELLILFVAYYLLFKLSLSIKRRYDRRKLKQTPFPERFLAYLEKIPHFHALEPARQEKLKMRIKLFLFEKEFVGIKKDVTDEMRVVIAFYASLIALELPEDCYHELKSVLVYPYRFIADEVKSHGGIYIKERFIMEGQSSGDVVVISWHEAKKEAYHLRSHNVIIHEFAHELDFEDGAADGVPPMARSRYDAWVHTILRHYQKLNRKWLKNREWGKYELFGPYAATSEAEFFAVLSELFFTKPQKLKQDFPDIYTQLVRFYRQDPGGWSVLR